jgi:hypothetical protein
MGYSAQGLSGIERYRSAHAPHAPKTCTLKDSFRKHRNWHGI